MNPFARLLRRVRYFLRRKEFDGAMEEELRFHVEKETEKNLRAGMSLREARRQAMIALGGVDRHVEEARRARGTVWLENALRDLKLGLREMRRRPLYALGVSGTLALGVAAATITFAVAWNVWLAPMPYPDPDRVVRLWEIEPIDPAIPPADQPPDSRRHLFSEALAADFHEHDFATMRAITRVFRTPVPDRPTRSLDGTLYSFSSVSLTPEGYEIFGIIPVIGRLPAPVEEEIMLSERTWKAFFGGDPRILGARLEGVRPAEEGEGSAFSQEIVGVARVPSGYPGETDLVDTFEWMVQGEDREFRWIEVIARIEPGFTVEQAEAEMSAFLTSLGDTHPEHRGWTVEAVVLSDHLLRPFRSALTLLLAAGATFLLLAAVNVLGLVAARRAETRHDRSIRLALGATELRLFRDSISESVLVAAIGTGTGLMGALVFIGPLRTLIPRDLPRLAEVSLSPPFLLVALGIGLGIGVVIGAGAYLMSSGQRSTWGWGGFRRNLPALSPGAGFRGPEHRNGLPRRAIVVGQVALTTVLTAAGAAILTRVGNLQAVDLGYAPGSVSMTSVDLAHLGYVERNERIRAIREALEVRGVTSAFALNTPMDGAIGTADLPLFSIRPDGASDAIFYELQLASDGYFDLLGVELLVGRPFTRTDGPDDESVAIVSADFAREYLPPGTHLESMVGRSLEGIPLVRDPVTVVGVARATRHRGPDQPPQPSLYIPFAQQRVVDVGSLLLAETVDDARGIIPDVFERLAPDAIRTPVVPYTSYWDRWFAPFRLQFVLIGALAALGLLLASLGLYSLLAYQVLLDRREIGIRKAVGAPAGSLLVGVVRRGMGLAFTGAAIGLVAWYQVVPFAGELVEGIDGAGVVVPVGVAVVLGGAALIATLLPGLKAARVDPMVTLRAE